jgi:hypothetical protein
MPEFLDPNLTLAQAGLVLEQEFMQRFGEREYERLYQTIDLSAQELSTSQEDLILGTLGLIGKTSNQTNLLFALIWLSKKEMSNPTAQEMLRILRQQTVAEVLQKARNARSQQKAPTD